MQQINYLHHQKVKLQHYYLLFYLFYLTYYINLSITRKPCYIKFFTSKVSIIKPISISLICKYFHNSLYLILSSNIIFSNDSYSYVSTFSSDHKIFLLSQTNILNFLNDYYTVSSP